MLQVNLNNHLVDGHASMSPVSCNCHVHFQGLCLGFTFQILLQIMNHEETHDDLEKNSFMFIHV